MKFAVRLAFLFSILVTSGCHLLETPIPNCSDQKTLDLARSVIAKAVLDRAVRQEEMEALKRTISFSYPRATKLEENIKKYSCSAQMLVMGTSESQTIDISYTSQIADDKDHIVGINGIQLWEAEFIRSAIAENAISNQSKSNEAPTRSYSIAPDPIAENSHKTADSSHSTKYEENIFFGKCLLEVNGKKYIDGQCPISMGSDGSFSIGAAESVPLRFFAMVFIIDKGLAEGHWNEEEGANHAHTPLGVLKYSRGCWQNEAAKVCAWK